MLRVYLKKMGSFLLVLLGITFISFMLSYLSPSDPAEIMMKKKGGMVTEEAVEQKREELGLNDAVLVQYGRWLVGICRGDFGTSYKSGKPVIKDILKTLPYTIKLTLLSMFLHPVLLMNQGQLLQRCFQGLRRSQLRCLCSHACLRRNRRSAAGSGQI